MTAAALIAEWTEDARALGREHASGPTSDDTAIDIIDLNALEALTGEGTSWGELADIQAKLEAAYAEGVAEGAR